MAKTEKVEQTINSRRFKTLFAISLAMMDAAMIALAFVVAYRLRVVIPWPVEAADMDRFSAYGWVLIIHIASILLIFFLFRLYHLLRATSRVDEFYAIFGGVFVGTLLSVALASLTLKNSVFEVNLPRVMVLYLWLIGALLVNVGRWGLQQIRSAMQSSGLVQDR